MTERDEPTAKRREAARRRSEAKTARQAEAIAAEAAALPIFAAADAAEGTTPTPTTPEEHFAQWQRMKARGVEGAGELVSGEPIMARWHLALVRRLAREALPPDVFAELDAFQAPSDYRRAKLTDALTGRRTHCIKRQRLVFLGPARPMVRNDGETWAPPEVGIRVEEIGHWPPAGPGWVPPYTVEQIAAMLAIDPPADYRGAVDPWNLGGTP